MDYDLNRFLKAQEYDYAQALEEIRNGRKRSHWIWYIFPQLQGLGYSPTSQRYAISGLDEAKAYMQNDILRQRLLEISAVLLTLKSSNATQVMGHPDDLKLKSSMTLFANATPEYPVFQQVLDKYFRGEQDQATLKILSYE